LQPLALLQKSQPLCNQANPASFCKTPGWGYLNASAPSFATAVTRATWRPYPLCPHSIAHPSCHHGGVRTPHALPIWATTNLATCLFAFTLFPALLTLTPAFSSLLPTSRWQFLTSPQYTNGDFDGRNL
jgi:hypothetical protein